MNQDSLAIHVLCSKMAIGSGARPFEPNEWAKFANVLYAKGKKPVDVLSMNFQTLMAELDIDAAMAERIEKLQDRSVAIGFELSEFENMGIGFVTRDISDGHLYPAKIKGKLKDKRPPVFCYAGEISLLKRICLGFAGSRDIGEEETEFTKVLAERAVNNGYTIVCGGANGVDMAAMNSALSAGGTAIVFPADSIMDKLKKRDIIKSVQNGNLLLISPFQPDAPWSVGNAMARNKYIYTQSDGVVVVKSDYNKGGTWEGASENIHNKWTTEYCWNNEVFLGNQELIKNGAIPIDIDWNCNLTEINDAHILTKSDAEDQISIFDGNSTVQ